MLSLFLWRNIKIKPNILFFSFEAFTLKLKLPKHDHTFSQNLFWNIMDPVTNPLWLTLLIVKNYFLPSLTIIKWKLKEQENNFLSLSACQLLKYLMTLCADKGIGKLHCVQFQYNCKLIQLLWKDICSKLEKFKICILKLKCIF